MRELVLDTETTGLNYDSGDRIVEIGVVELENHIQTGNYFHCYINPERKSNPEAEKIHGLTQKFLSEKPLFNEIAEEFTKFISDSKIIIHNAAFDIGFLNSELIFDKMVATMTTTIQEKPSWWAGNSSLQALNSALNYYSENIERIESAQEISLGEIEHLAVLRNKQSPLSKNIEELTKLHESRPSPFNQ